MKHAWITYCGLAFCAAMAAHADEPQGSLFDNVVAALEERYYDVEFRENVMPGIVERYRTRAQAVTAPGEQRQIVHEFLSNIPSSHTCLLSKRSHEHMIDELMNRDAPTFGFSVIEHDGKHYAHDILEGGPGDKAGLLRGDRIVLIDGILPDNSPRLDWRTDDAYLPDPPLRLCLGEAGDVIRLHVERRPGEYRDIKVPCRLYSSFKAAESSARIIESGGKRIGYLHLWLIHMTGVDTLLREKLDAEFAECDAFVFDLRGRGGNAFMVSRILDILEGTSSNWDKPVVALTNRLSRSAKDVIAYEIRERDIGLLVGETTSGAVIPATMHDVGYETYLMFPSFVLPRYSDVLEFVGVEPHVVVEEPGPYSAGKDPILETGLREAARLASVDKQRSSTTTAVAERGAAATEDAPVTTGHATPDKTQVKSLRRAVPESNHAGKSASIPFRAPEDNLTVATILQRMVEALGGEEAIRAQSAQTLGGKLAVGGMLEGTLTIHTAAPNLFLSSVELGGMGTFLQGFDGKIGWGDDPQRGSRILEGAELERMRIQADFYSPMHYNEN
ncbi:MAG: hypothetical protein JSU63_18755 [Phycisphaerales bacterium]|nr:MAG: hypothetical protein JSU63_18755 [Phycisphaerales bacterium]